MVGKRNQNQLRIYGCLVAKCHHKSDRSAEKGPDTGVRALLEDFTGQGGRQKNNLYQRATDYGLVTPLCTVHFTRSCNSTLPNAAGFQHGITWWRLIWSPLWVHCLHEIVPPMLGQSVSRSQRVWHRAIAPTSFLLFFFFFFWLVPLSILTFIFHYFYF